MSYADRTTLYRADEIARRYEDELGIPFPTWEARMLGVVAEIFSEHDASLLATSAAIIAGDVVADRDYIIDAAADVRIMYSDYDDYSPQKKAEARTRLLALGQLVDGVPIE